MSIMLSIPAAIAVVATALLVADGDHDLDITAAARCEALDAEQLTIDLQPGGSLELVYAGDDYVTCNEVIVVTSYASDGPVVDNHHDPVVDQEVIQVAALEAAGAAGLTVRLQLDECLGRPAGPPRRRHAAWEHVEGAVAGELGATVATDDPGADVPGFRNELRPVSATGRGLR